MRWNILSEKYMGLYLMYLVIYFFIPLLADTHLFQFCSYEIYVIFLFQTFPKKRKRKRLERKV
jgi:ABC-type transport system involved in multi-copper enzyme maturation permease subunit